VRACVRAYVCVCYICMYVLCMCVCIYVHVCLCMYMCMHACIYVSIYVRMYVYVYTYVHAVIYIYEERGNISDHDLKVNEVSLEQRLLHFRIKQYLFANCETLPAINEFCHRAGPTAVTALPKGPVTQHAKCQKLR
jgi:hypothetical protein